MADNESNESGLNLRDVATASSFGLLGPTIVGQLRKIPVVERNLQAASRYISERLAAAAKVINEVGGNAYESLEEGLATAIEDFEENPVERSVDIATGITSGTTLPLRTGFEVARDHTGPESLETLTRLATATTAMPSGVLTRAGFEMAKELTSENERAAESETPIGDTPGVKGVIAPISPLSKSSP